MSDDKKTLEQWEKKLGFLVRDESKRDPRQKLTQDEATELLLSADTAHVNHADRIKFLEDNGYEVTHENMINPELSAKPKEKSE